MLAAVPVLAVGLADATIALRTANAPATPARAVVAAGAHGTNPSIPFTLNDAEAKRNAAIHELLDRRRDAVLHHDVEAFLSTDDPTQARFVAQQRRSFDALSAVPIGSWNYAVNLALGLPLDQKARRYGVPTFVPSQFAVQYRIAGYDDKPTTLVQTPTFVQRDSGWYIASFSDFANEGNPSAVDIWDFGPVRSVRSRNVLVLGHPKSLPLMRQIAAQTAAAMPKVTKVWGSGWPRKVVVLVPTTQRELGQLVDDKGDLSQIAAVASAEVMSCPGAPNPVGGRIAINPRNWPQLSTLGRQVVLTHELTHVATRAATNACTPTWLIEGFADYVAYQQANVSMRIIASELAVDVRAGRVPTSLPASKDFDGMSKRLAQAYEAGYMACRLIASLAGERGLVRFYTAVGTSSLSPAHAVAAALTSILHLTPAQFTVRWQSYLRAQLL
jgi:hypothetical protein